MKKILIIATGGTIASTPGGNGLAPGLTGEELAAYVPELADIARVEVVQPMNIDSTNMRPADWVAISRTIMGAYEDFDGFVVLHGTDTMAYTAAALSYLIQGSPKPIVLTGSQQPMANPFTDARLNLYQSVLYATDDLSRVGMALGDIWPGGAGDVAGTAGPLVYDRLNERVIVLRLTPGLSPRVFDLLADDFDAIVLETFGIGGIPEYERASFERAIFGWVESGHTLALTTQVSEEGLDLGVYEVGRAYAENADILKGDDMTTEALVAKTMWALGQSKDPEVVRELFYRTVNHDRNPR